MVKIIAVANQKGGIGKTTTSVNLSACLHSTGRKVLVLDLDQQANATDTLQGKVEDTATIYDVLFAKEPIENAIQKTPYGDLIAGDPLLSEADRQLTQLGRERILKKALSTIKDNYDYIIIDTPPSLGIMLMNALTCADNVIIPVVPDHYTIQGLQRFFQTLEDVKEITNPDISALGILFIKYDERTNLSKELAENLPKIALENWNTKVFSTKIHASIAVQYSQVEHKGMLDYDSSNIVAIDYAEFTKEIINEVENG